MTRTDRNGNVHTYSFDVLGRQTIDAVTTLGTGVDGAVRRIETGYDGQGNAFLFTTYDAASGGNVVNQVQREFNGLGQLTKEWQEHSGAVNTSTSPKVQYGYSEMASSANHSRLTGMTYPNGTVVNYVYDSGLDASISRLSSQSSGGNTLEAYSYLGLGTVVVRAHPQPGVDLTYVKQSGESNGDAGDQYTGLDRFGRVVDQRWRKTSDGSHTDRFQYGHDRNSNRLYRDNLLNDDFDELYHVNGASAGYDGLNQLTDWRRGPLSDTNSDGVPDTVATASRSQGWDFDALGNWDSLSTNGIGESRTHNKQNQVTQVGSNNLTFDANGNLTLDEQGTAYTYDAWNRLVSADPSGPDSVQYTHDALGRRIAEDDGTEVDLYYSSQWQVLEERISGNATKQYVWSPVYIDALVLRDRDTDANGSLDERLYAQQDANFNVTAVISTSGAVQVRFALDAYGTPTFLNASWATQTSSASEWVYLHQGGRFQAIGNSYNFRHRDYSPTLGRWMQQDPIGLRGSMPSLYSAYSNNVASRVDPNGLKDYEFEVVYSRGNDERSLPNYETARITARLTVSVEKVFLSQYTDECKEWKVGFKFKYVVVTAGDPSIWQGTYDLHNDGSFVFSIKPMPATKPDETDFPNRFDNLAFPLPTSKPQDLTFTRSPKGGIIGATLTGNVTWTTSIVPNDGKVHKFAGGAYIIQTVQQTSRPGGQKPKPEVFIRQSIPWIVHFDTKTGVPTVSKFLIREIGIGGPVRPPNELLQLIGGNVPAAGKPGEPFPSR